MSGKALFGALSNLIPTSAYRSRLEPAIEALPQEKMTPEQALGSFKKFPGGVGEDELQFTGIKGILEQGQPVTKTSLLEQVRSNPLEITDVYKGDSPLNPDSINFDQAAHDLAWKKIDEAEAAGDWITVEKLENQIEMLPKFGQYTLPGGSNYQELLMTLPNKSLPIELQGNNFAKTHGYDPDLILKRGTTENAHWTEVIKKAGADNSSRNFQSSHYDEGNVLAHGRYNTRTIDGDKTLFIEEIQSDWHQAGRDKGYAGDVTVLEESMDNLLRDGVASKDAVEMMKRVTKKDTVFVARGRDGKLIDHHVDKEALNERLPSTAFEVVPDAPYKSTDKWAGLTFNRMLKQAVDSGHDRIAWTSGQIQADRYDLSKQIEKIAYRKNEGGMADGTYTVMMTPKGSGTGEITAINELPGGINPRNVTEKQLESVVGKEIAQKIVDGVSTSKGTTSDFLPLNIIEGEELEIGGEGMKEFYDKILPKISGKIAKKYNSKVEVSADSLYDANPDLIQGTGRNRIDAIENAVDEGKELGYVPDASEYKAIQNGDVWEAYFDYDVGKGQQVWSMKITPEMKKAVAGGVALSGAGVAVLPEGSE